MTIIKYLFSKKYRINFSKELIISYNNVNNEIEKIYLKIGNQNCDLVKQVS